MPEQVISDATVSAFRHGGQLATSLRVLCLQDSTADTVLRMLTGMLSEREIGNPFSAAADIGPVSTRELRDAAEAYVADMARRGFKVVRGRLGRGCDKGNFVAPTIIDLGDANALKELNPTISGPVLHVVRWRTGELDGLNERLNAVGCGVIGLHTRINEAAGALLSRTQAHSVCVNRAMHKPFVGMQPSGGGGAAGTGPMAAGPLTLFALQHNVPEAVAAFSGPFAPSSALSSDNFFEFPVQGADGRLTARREAMQRSQVSARARVEALLALAAEQRAATAGMSTEASHLTRLVMALSPITLPALTGEENTYELLPRGQVLCAGESLQAVIAQSMAATAFGNEVILLKSAAANEVAARLRGACRVVYATDAVSVMRGDVAGIRPAAVLTTAGHRDLPQIHAAATKHMVAVVPADDTGTYDWTRLVRERVITVNASAAGGNIQLMVLSEDGV